MYRVSSYIYAFIILSLLLVNTQRKALLKNTSWYWVVVKSRATAKGRRCVYKETKNKTNESGTTIKM